MAKREQTDLYVYFSRGTSPQNVYIAPDFDLTLMNVKNPEQIKGTMIGLPVDSLFCPVAVTTCSHDDRFTEITNSCGSGDNRILKFFFTGFNPSGPTVISPSDIKQQVRMDRLFNGVNLMKSFDLEFCPSGDEFTIFNKGFGIVYGVNTGGSPNFHDYQL